MSRRIPARPVDPDWLALREPADVRARDEAADLTRALSAHLLRRAAAAGRPLRLVDLGSGTGANVRYLAARLGAAEGQQWTAVDHDAALTVHAPLPVAPLLADVADLAGVLDRLGGADLVTAAALLDLLDVPRVTAVVDAVAAAGAAALFSLNVTGEVRFDPVDDADGWVAQAFDAHQRRDGRLGPDAGDVLAALLRERGLQVGVVATPWRLDAEDEPDLLQEYLSGRAFAATEWLPEAAGEVREWLDRRRRALESGELHAHVGHVDVLGLPA